MVNKLDTSVHRKPTNTGLLQHFDGRVDREYKLSIPTSAGL